MKTRSVGLPVDSHFCAYLALQTANQIWPALAPCLLRPALTHQPPVPGVLRALCHNGCMRYLSWCLCGPQVRSIGKRVCGSPFQPVQGS